MDAAKDGDTIIVYSGTYEENVDVNKELTIISQSGNPEDTVVRASDYDGITFDVTANNVTINGFKVENGDPGIHLDGVQNSNISNNRLFANSVGIVLNSSRNNILHNNRCSHMRDGIDISYSNNNFLSNNSFSAMEFCFFMEHSDNNILIGNSIGSEHPLWLRYSCNNTMSDNSISGGWEGIDLFYSSNNTMNNNSIGGGDLGIGMSHSNNTTMNNNYVSGMWGIGIHSSSYCTMSNNTVSTHGGDGFGLGDSNNNILKDNTVIEEWASGDRSHSFHLGSSNNNILTGNIARRTTLDEGWGNIHLNNSNSNLIYNNYFNSPNNVYDDGNNIWNITKTPGTNIIGGPFLGGNYWSDYSGSDTDGDGLGDTLIPYNAGGQIAKGGDYLPLVTPSGPPAIYTVNNSTGPAADFSSIQAAVDAAKDGDTIIVYSGIYKEQVNVNKELTIISKSGNPKDTIVQVFKEDNSYFNDYVFNINANNVTISGFTIEESWTNHVSSMVGGIYLDEVQHNNISNNILNFEDDHRFRFGIGLNSSSNNILSNNNIGGGFSTCITLNSSSNNRFTNNTLRAGGGGISLYDSSDNILRGNNADMHRYYGIRIQSSANNTLTDNRITRIYYNFGIYIMNSMDNVIYNNYFKNANNAYDDGKNIWNITKTPGTNIVGGSFLGGNYWSDYAGNDTDGDGQGDTLLPYDSEGQIANGGDHLPLVIPDGIPAVYTVNGLTIGPAADFSTIQAAVDAAKDGDTIIVYGSRYGQRSIDVNKELTILAQPGFYKDTVITGPPPHHQVGLVIFNVTANNVTIRGFKIGPGYGEGILLNGVQNCIVSDNEIDSTDIGISLEGAGNNTVSNNTIGNARFGIQMLEFCNNNTIRDNYVHACERLISTTESRDNVIYNNYFNSTNNVYDNGNNIWNITKTPGTNIIGGCFLGGNYWSDYSGVDNTGDGLGDTLLPYNSEGQIANGGDYLPLVTPSGTTPSIPATVDSEETDTSQVNYETSASRSGSRLVTRSRPGPAPDSTVLSFDPETAFVIEGEGTEIRVMADVFPEGLAGYNLTFSIEDPAIAEITEIEFPVWANLTASSGLPAASVYMTAFDGDKKVQAGAESVILGNLTVSGKAFGKTNLTITVKDLDDDSGNPVDATILEGSIEVKMALTPEYGNSPENPDTVGVYEGFTGNEEISSKGLETFYSIEWIKGNMLKEFFDFNGDGKIDFKDLVALFKTG